MCVAITLLPGTNLTLEEIIHMDRANADGFGMAWAYDKSVSWWKTTKVDPQEVLDRLQYWSDFPRLVHFRLATAGGTKTELCHPFDISPQSICMPEGSTNRMMIHNGHWNRWSEIHKLLDEEGLLPDKGPWSDSRLAAFLASQDIDWLQALGGRVAVLDADETIVRLGDWTELREGLFVSNKNWENCTVKRGGYSGYRSWAGWLDDDKEFQEELAKQQAKDRDKNGKGGKGKEAKRAEKERRSQQYAGAHWQDHKTKRWFKYDQAIRDVVDVTAEHSSGEEGSSGATPGPVVALVTQDDTEIAP